MEQPKTWCVMPFSHLNIKQEGKLSACWRYPDRIGDYLEDTLTETWNGEPIRELRRALLAGERPEGCKSCWDLEDAGVRSTRHSCLEDFKDIKYEDVMQQLGDDYTMPLEKISCIEIRFDNICNLMCRHCSPDYSSKWEHAVKRDDALMEKMKYYGTYRKMDYHVKLTDEMIEEIGSFSDHLKVIMIAGGEPLFHDKHYKFLEGLQHGAKNIHLSYNTNLNTLEYKGKSILDLWKNFKRVSMRVSIDANRDIYQYVRTHADLPKVETNIRRVNTELDNVSISATCTTNMLNITRLTSIFDYFNSLGVYVHTSLVQYPRALNPRVLPPDLKQRVTAKWNNWIENAEQRIRETQTSNWITVEDQIIRAQRYGDSVINYMNSEDWYEKHWQEFMDYVNALDKYHKTDILEWYPEFKRYWK